MIKTCPQNCLNRGFCDQDGVCKCEKNFNGSSCQYSVNEFNNQLSLTNLISQTLSNIYTITYPSPTSLDVLQSCFNQYSGDPFDYDKTSSTSISDLASSMMTTTLRMSLGGNPSNSKLEGISHILDFAYDPSSSSSNNNQRRLSSASYDPSLIILLQISAFTTISMAPGEFSKELTTKNYKFAFFSPDVETLMYTASLPRSSLEIYQNLSEFKTDIMTSAFSYKITIIKSAFSPVSVDLNSDVFIVHLVKTNLAKINISVPLKSITYHEAKSEYYNTKVQCDTGSLAETQVVCPTSKPITIKCNGTAGIFELDCSSKYTSECLVVSGNAECRTFNSTSDATLCGCSMSSKISSQLIPDIDNLHIQIASYEKELFLHSLIFHESSETYWISTFTSLIAIYTSVIILVAISYYWSNRRHKMKLKVDTTPAEGADQTVNPSAKDIKMYLESNYFNDIFSGVFSNRSYGDRLLHELNRNFSLLKFYNCFDKDINLGSMLISFTQINLMIIFILMVMNIFYPPDNSGECINILDEDLCLDKFVKVSIFSFRSCIWMVEENRCIASLSYDYNSFAIVFISSMTSVLLTLVSSFLLTPIKRVFKLRCLKSSLKNVLGFQNTILPTITPKKNSEDDSTCRDTLLINDNIDKIFLPQIHDSIIGKHFPWGFSPEYDSTSYKSLTIPPVQAQYEFFDVILRDIIIQRSTYFSATEIDTFDVNWGITSETNGEVNFAGFKNHFYDSQSKNNKPSVYNIDHINSSIQRAMLSVLVNSNIEIKKMKYLSLNNKSFLILQEFVLDLTNQSSVTGRYLRSYLHATNTVYTKPSEYFYSTLLFLVIVTNIAIICSTLLFFSEHSLYWFNSLFYPSLVFTCIHFLFIELIAKSIVHFFIPNLIYDHIRNLHKIVTSHIHKFTRLNDSYSLFSASKYFFVSHKLVQVINFCIEKAFVLTYSDASPLPAVVDPSISSFTAFILSIHIGSSFPTQVSIVSFLTVVIVGFVYNFFLHFIEVLNLFILFSALILIEVVVPMLTIYYLQRNRKTQVADVLYEPEPDDSFIDDSQNDGIDRPYKIVRHATHQNNENFTIPELTSCTQCKLDTRTFPFSCGHTYCPRCREKNKYHNCKICRKVFYREIIPKFTKILVDKLISTRMDEIVRRSVLLYQIDIADEEDRLRMNNSIAMLQTLQNNHVVAEPSPSSPNYQFESDSEGSYLSHDSYDSEIYNSSFSYSNSEYDSNDSLFSYDRDYLRDSDSDQSSYSSRTGSSISTVVNEPESTNILNENENKNENELGNHDMSKDEELFNSSDSNKNIHSSSDENNLAYQNNTSIDNNVDSTSPIKVNDDNYGDNNPIIKNNGYVENNDNEIEIKSISDLSEENDSLSEENDDNYSASNEKIDISENDPNLITERSVVGSSSSSSNSGSNSEDDVYSGDSQYSDNLEYDRDSESYSEDEDDDYDD